MNSVRGVGRSAFAAGLLLAGAVLICFLLPAEAQQAAAKEPAYRDFPVIGSRLAVWAIAQGQRAEDEDAGEGVERGRRRFER